MGMIRVLFLISMFLYCSSNEVKTTKLSKSQTKFLGEKVGQLLGFREYPTVRLMNDDDFDITREAPRYMLDLYERNKYSPVKKGNDRATTVRMIYGTVGKVTMNRQRMFIFNLSSVATTDKVMSAEVHVFKRKHMNDMWSSIQVMMYQISPVFVHHIGHDRLNPKQHGWQTMDVTHQIKRCLKNKKRNHLFGIYFKESDSKSNIKLKQFERRHSRPFLVIYSNDTQNLTVDHIEPRFTPKDLVSLEKHLKRTGYQADEPEKEVNSPISLVTDKPESVANTEAQKNVADSYDNDRKAALVAKRGKRSILDNEIPQIGQNEKVEAIIVPIPSGVNFKPKIHIPQTNPGILRSRSRHRVIYEKVSTKKPKPVTIPYPKGYRRKQRRRRRKQRRRERRKYRRRFDDSLWDDLSINEATGRLTSELCQKRRLRVNFADIGWNQWIISPKSFDAHYCAGSCPFPINRGLDPSNHATIQSIVHAIGLHNRVPAPCCVPQAMSSVTLLFFDENQNVVLKNYPGMSVIRCACR